MDNTCTSTPEILRTPQEARRRTVDANEWYTSSDPSQQRPTTLGAHSSMFNELTHGFPSRCALPRETAVPDAVTFVTGTYLASSTRMIPRLDYRCTSKRRRRHAQQIPQHNAR